MDWFSWLSKTGLEPSLVYEYGLALAHNELEEEDITYFNHEFLQSMGISIAKHRLEILKLAEKEMGPRPRPMSRLLALLKKTRRSFAQRIHAWIHRNDSALIVVPTRAYSKRWRGALLKRNKKLMLLKQQGRLMLTDGSVMVAGPPPPPPLAATGDSPMGYDVNRENDTGNEKGEEDECWLTGVEEIRWASMFQDLKPT